MQRHLYQVMAEVSAPGPNAARFRTIGADQVAWLEGSIERFSQETELPGGFVLGGDSPGGAALDLARTVVRRAERSLADLVILARWRTRRLHSAVAKPSCFVLIIVSTTAQVSPTMAKR
jgi:cob(I)alamin adenosyltransferase